MKPLIRLAALLWLAANLAACQSMAKPEMIGASKQVVNTVSHITIVRASFNGEGLSIGEECCISLPVQWQPGMTATIEWTIDPSPGLNPGGVKPPPYNKDGTSTPETNKWMAIHRANYRTFRKQVAVPPYQEVAALTLIILPCNEVYPLIDTREHARVMGNLPYEGLRQEIIRRLGAKQTCQSD